MDTTRWKKKTEAAVLSPARAAAWKRSANRHIVGVMGFSGAWRRSGLRGEALDNYVNGVHSALRDTFSGRKAEWGARLVMCSGATDIGVPGAAYRICRELNITTMGVTAGAAIRYALAPMAVLVPVGRRFGDESGVFVGLCDAFVLLGGGPQSEAETRAAHQQGKPVTIIRGFGGVADTEGLGALPGVRLVEAHPGRPNTPPSGR